MTAAVPPPTLSFDELVNGTDVSRRTLRRWTHAGVLAPPELRGPATRYPAGHRERLLAAVKLREQHLSLEEIRQRLEAQAPTPDLRVTTPSPAPEVAPTTTASVAGFAGEAWERVVLIPGLELHLSTNGSALLRRLAQEIVERYGTTAR